ncbi:mutator family transposase [Camelimonas lactis]|uniref:Mutator family transposase n=1 Tax=Camelimonas lactis TaxID=659006 RepID=A0A4R2GV82_9HYPH|nr:mutator family transposase [Camelimonas lactis]
MSAREIVGHLRELYGIDVSPDLISAVTDAVLEEVAAWQARPLEPVYPLVFFDALRVKVRDEGVVRNTHGDKAPLCQGGVKAGEQAVDGLGLHQPLTEKPDGRGVRHGSFKAQPKETLERQAVADLELRGLI